MGFDIDGHDYTHQERVDRTPSQSSTPEGTPARGRGPPLLRDTLSTGSGQTSHQRAPSSQNPNLSPPGQPYLPGLHGGPINSSTLARSLSPETRSQIDRTRETALNEQAFTQELKEFFELLARLYPLSLSLFEGLVNAHSEDFPTNFTEQALRLLTELGELLGKHLDSLQLPKEIKEQFQTLAQQLASLSQANPEILKGEIEKLLHSIQQIKPQSLSSEQMNNLAAALKDLLGKASSAGGGTISFDSDPELLQTLQKLGLLGTMEGKSHVSAKELEQLLAKLQKGMGSELLSSAATKNLSGAEGMLRSASSLLHLMRTMGARSHEGKITAFSSLVGAHNLSPIQNATGMIGPNTEQMATKLGKFIFDIQSTSGMFPKEVELAGPGGKTYADVFSQIILSGAVLGRMLAGGGKESLSDQAAFAQVALNATKDLKIIDIVPFSFMAFFADLRRDDDEGLSEAIKEAKQALMRLIRLLLQLVFILVAIASAGTKLGRKGMNQLLEEASGFIGHLLDDLTFALKKVDENYVVNVSVQLASTQAAKEALALKDYEAFWGSMIGMFASKTELKSFLKTAEEAEPLFNAIEAFLNSTKEQIPMTIME